MPRQTQIVDIAADPLEAAQRRRLAWRRIGVPLFGLVLVVAAILGIALYVDRANREGVAVLSDDLLATLDGRIGEQVASFLAGPAQAVQIARDIVAGAPQAERIQAAQAFAFGAIAGIPQILDFSFADGDGNYRMVRRGTDGGIDIKQVQNLPPPRQVSWNHRDAAGRDIGHEDDPTDTYDPRPRPWYVGAVAAGQGRLFWTGIYVFFTGRVPGLTVSAGVPQAKEGFVVGVDITLESLSQFLRSLRIGKSGRATIIDGGGHLVASSVPLPPADASKVAANALTPLLADEVGDPVLAAAYDRFRVEGGGVRVVELRGERYIVAASRLANAGRDWWVLITVPESDFLGFVARNGRAALLMSLGIVALVAVMGGLLLRQGLAADRNERRLAERTRTVSRQYAAYAALASEATLFDPGERPPDVLTETLADMTDARRASLWRLADDGQSLRCEDSFERENRGHVAGLELHRDEMPGFFEAVASGEELEVADAATDRRTGQLHRVLMAAHGSRSLFLVPLRRYGKTTGAIWLEDAAPTDAARDFVRLTANMMAFRMAGPLEPAGIARRVSEDQGGYVTEEVHHSADIARPSGDLDGVDPASLAADVYADVAVMVLHLPDAVSLAAHSREQASLADALACALQIVAADHALPYLKFLGQEVVAACGFGTADPGGLTRLADAAVTIRDRCIELFEAADVHPDFRIGLDCGVAIGAEVGIGPRVFNLWGEAVRAADAMAASALPAAIQVTGTAYARLRQDYLFRPRGRFYMAGVGQAQTFVLSGRL